MKAESKTKTVIESESQSREREPKINFTIVFGPHRTAEDLKNLQESFSSADVYVPECCPWSKKTEDIFRGISRGDIKPEDLGIDDKFREAELKMIYNSRKEIVLLDLPEKNSWNEDFNAVRTDRRNAFNFFTSGLFEEALKLARASGQKQAELEKKRESYIMSQARPAIEKLAENNTILKRKLNQGELNVLIRLGSGHTGFYHSFRKNESVEAKFGSMPTVFCADAELIRRYMFNKAGDEKIIDDIAARSLVERAVLFPFLESFCKDMDKVSAVSRKLSANIDIDDAREISESLRDSRSVSKTIEFLERKLGLKIPTSEEEIDKLLGVSLKK